MINSKAIVSDKAQIGNNVSIGPFTIIYDDVIIGDDSNIDGYCEIGYPTELADSKPLIIGNGSTIRSHSTFYQGSIFGEKLTTGHRVTVRENVVAGKNLQIGTLSDFQGDSEIGDYVRTHSNVHIGKLSSIGDFVWIYPYVVLTNDPHPPSDYHIGVNVESYAIIATMSVILPGVNIGQHSLVAAHSSVNRDVEAYSVVGGIPAKKLCDTSAIKLKDGTSGDAYPWPQRFHRGYPDEVVDAWIKYYS